MATEMRTATNGGPLALNRIYFFRSDSVFCVVVSCRVFLQDSMNVRID